MKNKTKKPEVSLVTIYEAKRCRDREDGRVSTEHEGYYSKYEFALTATDKYTRRRNFHSREVIPTEAIKVNGKFYELNDEITIIKPSKLENTTESIVALRLNNKKIIIVNTKPMRVK